jgi:hypothetical protein
MEEKAPLSLYCIGVCLGKWQRERQDVGGERERGEGLLGKRKGEGLWEFYRVCGFK